LLSDGFTTTVLISQCSQHICLQTPNTYMQRQGQVGVLARFPRLIRTEMIDDRLWARDNDQTSSFQEHLGLQTHFFCKIYFLHVVFPVFPGMFTISCFGKPRYNLMRLMKSAQKICCSLALTVASAINPRSPTPGIEVSGQRFPSREVAINIRGDNITH
jgi:hypothetical protein